MSISNIIENWDTVAFVGYNMLAKLLYLGRYPKYRKYLKTNKELKDKHKGKRCFIVLNGPSLNNYDLSAISDEYVFCTNYFFQSDYFNIIKPDYYCITDSACFSPDIKEDSDIYIKKVLQCAKDSKFIFNIRYLDNFNPDKDIYLTYAKHMPSKLKIKSDLSKMSSNFISVSLYAVNAAIFMGFSEIYMLGYDFEPGILKHFYKDSETEAKMSEEQRNEVLKDAICGRYWQYSIAQYQNYYIQKYAEKKGVSIFNCNENSCVRSFPFIKYDGLFQNKTKEGYHGN